MARRTRAADDGLGGLAGAGRRLAALRAELQRRGLDGFVVPRADEHQDEYVPRRSQRLAWLTGFTGSAGLAIVWPTARRSSSTAATRSRCARRSTATPSCRTVPSEPPEAWIAANLPQGGKLGYDPWLHTARRPRALRAAPRSEPAPSSCRSTATRRRGVARPAAAAAGAGRAASRRVRRRDREAKRTRMAGTSRPRAPTWRC